MAPAESTKMSDQELALIVLQQGKPQQVLAKFLNLMLNYQYGLSIVVAPDPTKGVVVAERARGQGPLRLCHPGRRDHRTDHVAGSGPTGQCATLPHPADEEDRLTAHGLLRLGPRQLLRLGTGLQLGRRLATTRRRRRPRGRRCGQSVPQRGRIAVQHDAISRWSAVCAVSTPCRPCPKSPCASCAW